VFIELPAGMCRILIDFSAAFVPAAGEHTHLWNPVTRISA